MRRTLRSFTWEYGTLIVVLYGLVAVPVSWHFLSVPISLALAAPMIVYGIYNAVVTEKYPRRGDLPEFKEYLRLEALEGAIRDLERDNALLREELARLLAEREALQRILIDRRVHDVIDGKD